MVTSTQGTKGAQSKVWGYQDVPGAAGSHRKGIPREGVRGTQVPESEGLDSSLSLMSCVTLGKWLCLSEHQFPKLKMVIISNSISLIGCKNEIKKMWIRHKG